MTALAFPWRTLGPLEIPPKLVLKGDPPVGSQPHGAAAAIPGHTPVMCSVGVKGRLGKVPHPGPEGVLGAQR